MHTKRRARAARLAGHVSSIHTSLARHDERHRSEPPRLAMSHAARIDRRLAAAVEALSEEKLSAAEELLGVLLELARKQRS